MQEEAQDLFPSSSPPAGLQRAQGAHLSQLRGPTQLTGRHTHTRQETTDTERNKDMQTKTRRESERGRYKNWGRGTNIVCSVRRVDSETFTDQAVFLILHEKKIVPTSRPRHLWDLSLPWMVKMQEEGDEKKRGGREKRGR